MHKLYTTNLPTTNYLNRTQSLFSAALVSHLCAGDVLGRLQRWQAKQAVLLPRTCLTDDISRKRCICATVLYTQTTCLSRYNVVKGACTRRLNTHTNTDAFKRKTLNPVNNQKLIHIMTVSFETRTRNSSSVALRTTPTPQSIFQRRAPDPTMPSTSKCGHPQA